MTLVIPNVDCDISGNYCISNLIYLICSDSDIFLKKIKSKLSNEFMNECTVWETDNMTHTKL